MTPRQLRAARKRLRLSCNDFATLCGVASERTVRRWEAGTREIDGKVILLLSVLDGLDEAAREEFIATKLG